MGGPDGDTPTCCMCGEFIYTLETDVCKECANTFEYKEMLLLQAEVIENNTEKEEKDD